MSFSSSFYICIPAINACLWWWTSLSSTFVEVISETVFQIEKYEHCLRFQALYITFPVFIFLVFVCLKVLFLYYWHIIPHINRCWVLPFLCVILTNEYDFWSKWEYFTDSEETDSSYNVLIYLSKTKGMRSICFKHILFLFRMFCKKENDKNRLQFVWINWIRYHILPLSIFVMKRR